MTTRRKSARVPAGSVSADLLILREAARLLREIEERVASAELLRAELRGLVRARFVVSDP